MEEDSLEGTIEVDYKIRPLLYDEDEDGEELGYIIELEFEDTDGVFKSVEEAKEYIENWVKNRKIKRIKNNKIVSREDLMDLDED